MEGPGRRAKPDTTRGTKPTDGRPPTPGASAPRDGSAIAHEIAGRQRDVEALARDREADLRDVDAQARDELSERLENPPEKPLTDREAVARAALLHRRAVEGRALAARDRALAERDRERAAVDRLHAAEDRAAAVRAEERRDAAVLEGLAPGDPGLEALGREIERANRTSVPLSVAFVAVLTGESVAESVGDAIRRASAVATAVARRLRSYDLVVSSADGEALVCALTGVPSSIARVRMESVRIDVAQLGVAIEVGLAELAPGDTPSTLVERAGAAI